MRPVTCGRLMFVAVRGLYGPLCRFSDISPKYDNENLGCGFNGQVVGFGGVTKIRKVPELVQGLFTLDFGYLGYVFVFIFFDEHS
jgi:hypothetical protein